MSNWSNETKDQQDAKRDRYVEILKPLFLPDDPVSHDIINYFASLLRVVGMETSGWDPYAESRASLEDLSRLLKVVLPQDLFPNPNATRWRINLLIYSHIVEMDAPYEVLTNLLRFRLGKGYSPNPFFDFLSDREKRSHGKNGVPTYRKIQIIKRLSDKAGFPNSGAIFDDFYYNHLRNAVVHSDYVLAEDEFRCRGGTDIRKSFRMSYNELAEVLVAAKAFMAAFFQIELGARRFWGLNKQKAVPYDPHNKGLMEVLVTPQDIMCGFRVLWPNGTESRYRRTEYGVEMINCYTNGATIPLFVGQYAQHPGGFSPLVEHGAEPVYNRLDDSCVVPTWPADGYPKSRRAYSKRF